MKQICIQKSPKVYAVTDMIRIHFQETLENDQSSYPTGHFLAALVVDHSFVDPNF